MENDNFVGLFNTNDYPELEEKVNELLKDKSEHLPKLKKCTLKRIDFCINAELDNQEQVKAYIKTMKRGNIPHGLELFEMYDYTAKRTKPTKDDFTVYSKDYISISIYNKYQEMKKQKDNVFPESEIERAKNIVRIEIRCMEGKIKTLKEKYDIKSISSFMRCAHKIGNDLYKYYLGKMFGKGMIYTYRAAMGRIDMSEYKQKHIKLLKEFIKDCNQSRSAADTYTEFKNIYGKDKTKRILEKFEDIATNYVTVANSDSKLFDNKCLPSPLELYEDNVLY